MHVFVAAIAGLSLATVATWCATGSRARRAFAVVLGVGVLVPPWLLPAHLHLLRGAWALVAFTTTMRVVDVARTSWTFRRRVEHVASAVDSRRLVSIPPRLEAGALARLVAWSIVVGAAALVLVRAPPLVVRWIAGSVVSYAAVSAIYELLTLGYAATGKGVPPLHVAPIFARSVQELWGERWARPINEWLRDTFFRPLARRRMPVLGLVVAFVVSAAFHAYAVWAALGLVRGLAMAGVMFAYFVAQALVMILERALRVTRWPAIAGRAWTIAWMLATAPLFVEPLLRVLGVAPAPGMFAS